MCFFFMKNNFLENNLNSDYPFLKYLFFLRFQLFMQNYLKKLTKIMQFQKTNNANRFYWKKTSRKLLYHFFDRFYFVSVLSLENKILRFIRKSRFYSNRLHKTFRHDFFLCSSQRDFK